MCTAVSLVAASFLVGCSSEDLTAIDPPGEPGLDEAAIGGESASNESSGEAALLPQRKRGIAYGYHSNADLQALSEGIGWWYNWAAHPDDSLSASYTGIGVEYVPMVWGGSFNVSTLNAQIPSGAKYLLAFNEPNFGSQANLTPQQAAALWPQLEQLAAQRGMKLVAPALNYCGGNCNETDPFVWLDKFFAACKTCKVDYIAAHWYACSKGALEWYLGQYKAKYAKPLWLTEFSCLDDASITVAKEQQYMQEAIGVLEADPTVFRYAWFSGRFPPQPAINLLGQSSGQLTQLGQKYVTLPGLGQ